MESLAQKKCIPCHAGSAPLAPQQRQELLVLIPGWELKEKQLKREFTFKNYVEALEFVKKISVVAEGENHHPDVAFGWGYARLSLTTHTIGDVSENDFVLAAKINELY